MQANWEDRESFYVFLESMKGKKSGKKGKSSSNVFSMFEQQQDRI